MESKIAESIGFRYGPVAMVLTHVKPEGARQFKEGKWGCVMFLLAAAARGETAVFDRKTFGCWGGGVGLGFGNQYRNFPGGEECFCYFLSVGNEQWEQGRETAEKIKPFLRSETYDDFLHGEKYVHSPQLVKKFIECLPIVDIPFEYVVLKPLAAVDSGPEKPEIIIFLGDMDQISALTILANYHREDNENVIFPYAAGCQSIGIYPLQEAESEKPRAVLGLSDISARVALKRLLKDDVMSFAVPFRLFREMEENVAGSFLERNTWKNLLKLKSKS
jgi:uncharacterized protein (DUF169 family)